MTYRNQSPVMPPTRTTPGERCDAIAIARGSLIVASDCGEEEVLAQAHLIVVNDCGEEEMLAEAARPFTPYHLLHLPGLPAMRREERAREHDDARRVDGGANFERVRDSERSERDDGARRHLTAWLWSPVIGRVLPLVEWSHSRPQPRRAPRGAPRSALRTSTSDRMKAR